MKHLDKCLFYILDSAKVTWLFWTMSKDRSFGNICVSEPTVQCKYMQCKYMHDLFCDLDFMEKLLQPEANTRDGRKAVHVVFKYLYRKPVLEF